MVRRNHPSRAICFENFAGTRDVTADLFSLLDMTVSVTSRVQLCKGLIHTHNSVQYAHLSVMKYV